MLRNWGSNRAAPDNKYHIDLIWGRWKFWGWGRIWKAFLQKECTKQNWISVGVGKGVKSKNPFTVGGMDTTWNVFSYAWQGKGECHFSSEYFTFGRNFSLYIEDSVNEKSGKLHEVQIPVLILWIITVSFLQIVLLILIVILSSEIYCTCWYLVALKLICPIS